MRPIQDCKVLKAPIIEYGHEVNIYVICRGWEPTPQLTDEKVSTW
jgi:hypothetical protein